MLTLQSNVPREKLEEDVDHELDIFSKWVDDKGGPLSRPERSILKTYLAWKLGVPVEKHSGP